LQDSPCRIVLHLLGNSRLDQSPQPCDIDQWSKSHDLGIVRFLSSLRGLIKSRMNAHVLINLNSAALGDRNNAFAALVSDVYVRSVDLLEANVHLRENSTSDIVGALSIKAKQRQSQGNIAYDDNSIRYPIMLREGEDCEQITHWIRMSGGKTIIEKIGSSQGQE